MNTLKIAICAGHHARRRGAVNKHYGLNEYDEACKVNLHLARLLIDAGHEVHEIAGALSGKIKQINAGHFDLALDLHFNADADHLDPDDLNDARGHGAMVMFCPKAAAYADAEPQGTRRHQAGIMAAAFAQALGNRNLGGRAGWYWGKVDSQTKLPLFKDGFLRKTNCAAFIPEPGYIDNRAFAEEWLVSNRHEEIAQAIAAGIVSMAI